MFVVQVYQVMYEYDVRKRNHNIVFVYVQNT